MTPLDELKQAIRVVLGIAMDVDELDEDQLEAVRVVTAYMEHGPTPNLYQGRK